MDNRNKYTKIEDLLSDASFRHWILKEKDTKNWEEWTLESPTRGKLVEGARLFLIALGVNEKGFSQLDIQQALNETRHKILLQEIKARKSNDIWNKAWFRAAAVLLISLSIYFYNQTSPSPSLSINYDQLVANDEEGLIEQTNNSSKPHVVSLSDGSSVLLQPKSKLSYPKKFSDNVRKVFLSGEAFFEIKKNPSQPFLVYANEVVTKVLGTSFRVKAYENDTAVEVIVKTGKVNVSQNQTIASNNSHTVDLLPNESIIFNRKKIAFESIQRVEIKPMLAKNVVVNIEQLSFEFKDRPVSEILATIEKAYAVEINYSKEIFKNCYLTTSLNDQPLTEKLNILCESLGNNTRYELNNNEITIKSNGCH